MKKILLISTGGTIASTPTINGLTPTVSGSDMVQLIPELEGLCEIHYTELLNLDSSNMQPEEWASMASAAFTALSIFDGVVITHGTDTMAYSAAALSFMLQHLHKPVVLTGSQLPIEDPGTDGKKNILDAFRVAVDGRLCGVYIVFDGLIIPGYCARKTCSRNFHAFESINRKPAGEIVNDEVVLTSEPEPPARESLTLNANYDPSVLLIKLVPGTKPELIEAAADLGYRAVVIEAFGLGGIPNVRRTLLPAIHSLISQKIPVVVTTQCIHDGCDLNVYDVGVDASKAGVLSAGTMTTEAIVAKLMWILGQTDDFQRIISMFYQDYIGEINKK
ncbi:asparaginase [Fusibacillus kribbianus]|uniref:asparaginase n=1 Tax=Fusibacillus kribbianus TaxID=3044208 RepID=A0AAP4EYA7_9FIRM|nr:asparaginase [Ruminococcus sp. YH-rum2234]MDI9242712.1 asparaginase [Ruminococcus sp. YH-rum2234]